jgi:hypothetical protein
VRPTDREADPISEHLTRRDARLMSTDARARRYALRSVQPSPARQEAPEPNAWLPIDLTAELAVLDLTGELEAWNIGGRIRGRGVVPHALQEIGPVDRRRTDAHAHLAAGWFGTRSLDELEDLGTTGLADRDRAHDRL